MDNALFVGTGFCAGDDCNKGEEATWWCAMGDGGARSASGRLMDNALFVGTGFCAEDDCKKGEEATWWCAMGALTMA
ncbi:hypothetical protein U1Q18_032158 [Sarracenia purpurea var. burkii]